MRVRSLMVSAVLLAAVCSGTAHAGPKGVGAANNFDALFAPVHFNQFSGVGSLDELTQGLNIQTGYSFDSSGQFNVTDIESSSAYDGQLLSAPWLNLPYVALTSDVSDVGSAVSLGDGFKLRLGVESLSAPNPQFGGAGFSNLSQFDGPQQFDLRAARSGVAAMDWDFASWGGLGVVASHTSEQNGVLGSMASGLAKSAGNTTLGTSAHVAFGDGWVTTVSYSQGITNLDLRANSLAPSDETLHNASYGLAIAKHGVFANDSLGLSVIRPLDTYSSNLGFQPDGFDTGSDMIFGHERNALTGQTSETDLDVGYVTSFFNGALALQANVGYQMNFDGQSGTNSLSVISRAKINF